MTECLACKSHTCSPGRYKGEPDLSLEGGETLLTVYTTAQRRYLYFQQSLPLPCPRGTRALTDAWVVRISNAVVLFRTSGHTSFFSIANKEEGSAIFNGTSRIEMLTFDQDIATYRSSDHSIRPVCLQLKGLPVSRLILFNLTIGVLWGTNHTNYYTLSH